MNPSDQITSRSSSAPGYKKISIVCPCYNEEEVIPLFYQELVRVIEGMQGYSFEIIFVDDGSKDSTLAILNQLAEQDSRVQVYSLTRNFGHQIALTAGLNAATGEALIFMDSDLQHPPSMIPEMVRLWEGGYDIVSTRRQQTADAGWFKKMTSSLFYRIFNALSEVTIPAGAADFTLLSHRCYQALRRMPEHHRFLRGLISWLGYSRILIPYTAPTRAAGVSKYSLLKMYRLAIDAVMSFSATPLKIAMKAGFLIALLGFLYMAWIIGRYFILRDLVTGWGSLISVVLIIGGSQLFFIGLIGQYIAKIYEEVKNRPHYVLKQAPGQKRSDESE